MKIIVTTSDKYHHLLPVFFYLYNKYWGDPFDLVGHAKPKCELPDNCTWVSVGAQTGPKDWSTQLRPYFEQQPDWFVWMMEDTFIKSPVRKVIDEMRLPSYRLLGTFGVGRKCLTDDLTKRPHSNYGDGIEAYPGSRYRLSTQPSIWNKRFLLQYLTPGLSPWDFETQDPINDDWIICADTNYPVTHNEGVRRFDIHKLNLEGMSEEDIEHIKTITDKW
ncbi:MAG: hypothetical protein IPJ02_17325 [Chitinophagaceae bacterium]|nr:hypothetical protein [Chitinophagaceae bacterium]